MGDAHRDRVACYNQLEKGAHLKSFQLFFFFPGKGGIPGWLLSPWLGDLFKRDNVPSTKNEDCCRPDCWGGREYPSFYVGGYTALRAA